MKQQTKHMIFSSCKNCWQTQCWDMAKCLGGIDLYSMKLKLGTPTQCVFFLLYPFNTDINVIIWNTPHQQNIIIWCPMSPHDAPVASYSFWQECMCMCLVCWADSFTQNVDTEADTLTHPHIGWETVTPGTYHDALPRVFWHAPTLSQPGYDLLKSYQKYNWQGMYKDWPK